MKPKSPKNAPKKRSEKVSEKSDQKVTQKAPKWDPKTAKKGEKTKIAKTHFFQNPKNGFSVFFGSKISSKTDPKTRQNEKVSKTLKSTTLTAFEHGF